MAFPYKLTGLFLVEVNNMDIFWSGLAQRASENTWNEKRSQFSNVHETAIQEMIKEKKMKKINLNYFFLGTGFGFSLGFFFSLLDMILFAS